MASRSLPFKCRSRPAEKALNASSDEVVTAMGASNFWIVLIDSPSFSRKRLAILPSTLSTCSLVSATSCWRASTSPVRASVASSAMT